jgi:hypothetical protein
MSATGNATGTCADVTAVVTDVISVRTKTQRVVVVDQGIRTRTLAHIACRSRSPRDRRSSRRSRSRDHKSSSHHHHTSSRRSRSKDRSSRRDKTDDKSPTKVTAEQPTEQEVVTATEQPSTTNGGIASVVASE